MHGLVCFAAFTKVFLQECAKRKRDSLTEPERQAAADKLKDYKQVFFFLHRLLDNFDVTMLQIHYANPENREKKRKAHAEYNDR
jgi:hypothetical protein